MTLTAAGLALTSGPATDAIMGSLPPAKAGAGSTVNDTTRELSGALGVAVIGSVMASVYGPQVLRSTTHLGAPAAAAAAAALAFLPARARRPRPGSAPTPVPVRTRSPGQGAAHDRRHSPARLPSRPAPQATASR